jgi:putative oxidoreductase
MKTGRLSLVCAAIRWIVGGIFVYAGILKLMDPHGFAMAIDAFRLLPFPVVRLLAMVLPVLEILAGFIWICNYQADAAALIVLMMCGLFVVALSSALARGLDIQCGCFGGIGNGSLSLALVRALLLAGATFFWLRYAGGNRRHPATAHEATNRP